MTHLEYEYDPREMEYVVSYDGKRLCTVGSEWLLEYCGGDYMSASQAIDRLIGERIVEYVKEHGEFTTYYFLRRALFG